MNNAIEINNLVVRFESFTLDVDRLAIPKGYVTGIIGRNGAGKTTLIRSILSLYKEIRGDIKILDMTMKKEDLKIKDRIGYVSDTFLFPKNYSAAKIGKTIGLFYSRYDDALYYQLLKRLDIDPKKKAQDCSQGTQAKLSLVFALACHPDLLILDEPTAHLDPVARRQVLDLLYENMQQEENTILFSTHITSDLDRIADYILHIEEGKVNFLLSKEELLEDYQYCYITGERFPNTIRRDLKKIKTTEQGFEAICTAASRYQNLENVKFRRLTVEEVLIALDDEYE